MRHQHRMMKSLRDLNVFTQSWRPDGPVKFVILLVHGLGEHSGRYANVVNYFCPRGAAIYTLDHVGHGQSEGISAHVESFDDFIVPLRQLHEMALIECPGVPVVLLAHSLGGLIAARYLLDCCLPLSVAVLSGSAVKVPDSVSSLTIAVGKLLARVWPTLRMVKISADGVSRDPAVVAAYKSDPLVCHRDGTVRLGDCMLATMTEVLAKAGDIALPVLLIHGAKDCLIEPEASRRLYGALGSTDKQLIMYPELFHEVFNEPEHGMVLCDVENWLRPRIAGLA